MTQPATPPTPPAPPVPTTATGGGHLEVAELRVWFPIHSGVLKRRSGWVKAVDGVTFDIGKSETLGLVGESGSGKTTIGRTVVRVAQAQEGSVKLDGEELLTLQGTELRRRRRKVQMVFQDPYSSLDPRHTIGDTLGESLIVHQLAKGKAKQARIAELLSMVGLDPRMAERYPHEFSGGQRQRIGIARALAVEPEVIVCDEPVSALDVSVQAQVINLMERLQGELGLTYLFIAHDLAVVRHIADRVAVLYLGKMMEIAPSDELYRRPLHPYTIALLSAIPIPDARKERKRQRVILTGDIPSPANPPSGCRFHTRCWLRERLGNPERCKVEEPPLASMPDAPAHQVACHYPDEAAQGVSPVE
jgi:oligopeptide/dipeptide ABC transporter ATP-binding protein